MPISLFQKATSLESDLDTPVGLFLRLVGEGKGILFESAAVDGRWGRYSIIATDFVLSLACREGKLAVTAMDPALEGLCRHAGKAFPAGLRECLAEIAVLPERELNLPPITRAVYGYLGYGLAGLFEPDLAAALPPEEAEATLVLPGTLLIFDHGYNRITRLELYQGEGGEGSRVLPLPPSLRERGAASRRPRSAAKLSGKENYTAAVARTVTRLRQGDAAQVVLSTPFEAPLEESPFGVYRRLRQVNPSPYMFYMRFDDGVLLGSSPEVMVSCDRGRLRLCPIAGTRPRSTDLARDALFGDELLQDPKEKAEHAMLVDLGRDDLAKIATPGSVKLERFMEVERFSHVMHLTSRIGAELAGGKDALDVLAATFPAGTVSGAPRVRAMEIIAEEEGSPRGPYAGAIGWISLDEGACSLDFGITIRSLWIREGRIHWQAGAGIVQDSVPEREWAECFAKAAVMRSVVSRDAFAGETSGDAVAEVSSPSEGPWLLAHVPEPLPGGSASVIHSPLTAASLSNEPVQPDEPVQMSAVLEELAQGHDLTPTVAAAVFNQLMGGELTPAQAGAFLLGLRAKGESPVEVGAAADAVLARAVPVPPVSGPVIDVVGTGGDRTFSFNCSTATALTLAGMGHKVLKHGNRSVSSRSGSADVLEQLGIPLDTGPEAVPARLAKENFVFLFAPRYHPAFKHVMPLRRELGVRTLFNLLGPLVNPARPTHHLLGVSRKDMLPLVAETLARRGKAVGAVVCGAGGYDELTPLGTASVIFVNGSRTVTAELDPAAYGVPPCTGENLAVGDPEDAARVLRELLCGKGPKPMRDMLALNVGLALYLLDTSPKRIGAEGYDAACMAKSMELAMRAVADGAGRRFADA